MEIHKNMKIIMLVLSFLLTLFSVADVVIPSDRVTTGLNVRDVVTGDIIGYVPKGVTAKYISSIPSYYIIELENGTQGKVSKSWSTKIEGSISSTIKIASFNIQIFGKTKANKPDVMNELASIIRKYDIVAIQEIKDKDGVVPPNFLDLINSDGSEYSYIISERGGQQSDDQGSQEQYAYYYDNKTIKTLSSGSLYNDGTNDYFQREPYIARFGSVKGGLTFVLINIHTKPDEAIEEVRALHHVIKEAQINYPGEDDFMALGDFNASCDYASSTDFDNHPISEEYTWLIPDSADTNVSPTKSCAYDRMIITNGMKDNYSGNWGIDTVSDKKVSDHYPIWSEFSVGQHN